MAPKRKLLGEQLLKDNLINTFILEEALKKGKRLEKRLGEILVSDGVVSEEDIASSLGKMYGFEYISINNIVRDDNAIKTIPEDKAKLYNIIPISKDGNVIKVGMADPLNVFIIDSLSNLTGCEIKPAICTPTDVKNGIIEFYGCKNNGNDSIVERDLDASVIEMVDNIIRQGCLENASDIHIEPGKDNISIRFRMDGVLHDIESFTKDKHPSFISRLKIMAGIDISEKRKPQDGGFQFEADRKAADIRVSTLPTMFGEKIVMRILDKSSTGLAIDKIGFSSQDISMIERFIHSPYGILLVTGPTGSGKTTTLNSFLKVINSREKNIVTIEDPIEYQVDGINQVQINPKAGITFANGLRSILRQDPDIIMVGEIRDKETAEIAIQSSLTGHLVISTLHTNDAPTAITRLIDIGIEPFLVASSIIGIIGQRLVRIICPKCKHSFKPDEDIFNKFKEMQGTTIKNKLLYKGEGCINCKRTGYKGRTGIFEIMPIDEEIKKMIMSGSSSTTIRKKALESGFRGMRENGMDKVWEGFTTLEEVLRVTMN